VSFTDCLAFALMRRDGIRKAFSFDRHFVAAGFELWP
jgi:predicted nucleic acid-binding protein